MPDLPRLPREVRRAACAAALLALLAPDPVAALPPEKHLTQYVFDSWQTREGLPVNGILSIAQTPDGYLWLATEEGLIRFDGVDFRTIDLRSTTTQDRLLPRTLYSDRSGTLWIGTSTGLAQWRNKIERVLTTRDGMLDNRVQTIHEDRHGVLWIGTAAGLNRLEQSRLTAFSTRDGLPHNSVQAILEARDGSLWIGTNRGLARFDGRSFTTYTAQDGLAHDSVLALHEDRAGALWIGTFAGLCRMQNGVVIRDSGSHSFPAVPVNDFQEDSTGRLWISTYGRGIGRLSGNALEIFAAKDGLSDDLVRDIYLDHDGSLWIGTDHAGLARLKNGLFSAITTREGLPHDTVRAVMQDVDGSILIATHGGGLSSLGDDGLIHTVTRKDGLLSDLVFSLGADSLGNLWIGSYNGGLNRRTAGRLFPFHSDQLPTNQFVTSIFEDRDGTVWLGTYGGGLKRLADGNVTTLTTKDGLANDFVWSIEGDRDGTIWIGTRDGLSRLKDRRLVRFTAREGWPADSAVALLVDDDGTVWAGTESGLVRTSGEGSTRLTTEQGLFHDDILGIVEDGKGRLWMSTNKGIFSVPKRELTDVAEKRRGAVTSTVYGIADGMKSAECNGGTQPSVWRARDGRLWFATARGVVFVDPNEADAALTAPAVNIDDAIADALPLAPGNASAVPTLPPGSHRFEFHYSAPALRSTERLRYRYRLEPLERDWIDAGPHRVAYYTNVPPGEHRFRVMASYDGQSWNERGVARWTFRVQPHIYQTWWFLGLCVAGVSAVAFGGHRYRLNRLVAIERVRMRIASDLHDDIGSSLSQIAILSEVARRRGGDDVGVIEPLDRIATLSRESVDAMGDIVWAINPHRDTPTDLAQRMRRLAIDLLQPRDIDLHFTVNDEAAPRLGADVRRQLFLLFKEALTNVVRHADASHVHVDLKIARRHLRLVVVDDGRGMDVANAHEGQGLKSMGLRVASLGGHLSVSSEPGRGTRIVVNLPIAGRRLFAFQRRRPPDHVGEP